VSDHIAAAIAEIEAHRAVAAATVESLDDCLRVLRGLVPSTAPKEKGTIYMSAQS